MIRSAEPDSSAAMHPVYDLCVIGSGPAGMTVCVELSDTNLRICVLESGGINRSIFADKLRAVESAEIKMPEDSQERILGGSSETWSGLCAPLDSIDFVPRPLPHHIGWPISKTDLYPYYERAAMGYKFPHPNLFDPDRFQIFGSTDHARFSWKYCEEKVFLKPSPIFRFGTEFRYVFQRSPTIDLITDATVTYLVLDDSSNALQSRVDAVVCKTSKGKEFRIRANVFVLATGAIENARILLNSRSLSPQGLGNEHDQVGRYLMNHPKGISGLVSLRAPIEELGYYSWRLYDGGIGYVGVRLREEVQKSSGFLNCYVQLDAHYPWSNREEPAAFRAILAELKSFLHHLIKRDNFAIGDWMVWRRYLADFTSLLLRWRPLLRAAWHALIHFPGLLWLILIRLSKGRHPRVKAIRFWNYLEMEPNPENRVTLGQNRDALGVPIPHVRHATSDRDLKSLLALHDFLAGEFERLGIGGTLASNPAALASTVTTDAYHYLGTTRMGTDPTTSVVNSDLRVHSIVNLYVAGGSVFPTSGCANPAMTIVALSIRLSDHLRYDVFGLPPTSI